MNERKMDYDMGMDEKPGEISLDSIEIEIAELRKQIESLAEIYQKSMNIIKTKFGIDIERYLVKEDMTPNQIDKAIEEAHNG